MIHVAKTAQHTIADQINKNIMLSSTAKAIAVPQLEIETNDVCCKHGAAISDLNDEHFFYLQSRGLDKDQTKQMLVSGFLKQ